MHSRDPAQNHGAMQHRGITHWWGLPTLAGLALWVANPYLASSPWWPAGRLALVGLLAGWSWHLVADFVFGAPVDGGRRGPRRCACRGAGIPLAPWWWHVGILGRRFGFRAGGWTARLATVIVLPGLSVYFTLLLLEATRSGRFGT